MGYQSQIEKRYESDWAKSKARSLLREMVNKYSLVHKKPENLRVLCFPGISATEIFEVYDPLGIKRENIVGVEREQRIASQLHDRGLGIQIVPSTLEDYVASQPELAFDVVSLDYTSPINSSQLEALAELSKKQNKSKFVLHHANLMKRDRQSYYLYNSGYGYSDVEVSFSKYLNKFVFKDTATINNKLKEGTELLFEEDNVRSIKQESYSALLRSSFEGGNSRVIEQAFRFVSGEYYEPLLELVRNKIDVMVGEKISINQKYPLSSIFNQTGNRPDIARLFEEMSLYCLTDWFRNNYGKGKDYTDIAFVVLSAIAETFKGPRFFKLKDAHTYSYISESGAPMIGDIYFLQNPVLIFQKASKFANLFGFPNNPKKLDAKKFHRGLREYTSEIFKFSSNETDEAYKNRLKQRKFLGNSSRPVLTKQRAIDEMEKGTSIESIKEKYRGWKDKPLSQWKAHVTMGTYNKIERREEELVEYEEDSNLEKITKGEAVDLISSGIPLEEILSAYPTSFSPGQLRAFKAHITMGTYQN